jgi:putative transposase
MNHMAGRKKHSAEDVVRKLRRADELAAAGKTNEEIAAELEVSAATLYNWRRTYGGMDVDAAKELKELLELCLGLERHRLGLRAGFGGGRLVARVGQDLRRFLLGGPHAVLGGAGRLGDPRVGAALGLVAQFGRGVLGRAHDRRDATAGFDVRASAFGLLAHAVTVRAGAAARDTVRRA